MAFLTINLTSFYVSCEMDKTTTAIRTYCYINLSTSETCKHTQHGWNNKYHNTYEVLNGLVGW